MLFCCFSRLKCRPHQRKKAVALLLTFSTLPSLAAAQNYDALIVAAREGNNAPALRFFDGEAERRTLSASEIADWLQIASWAGEDRQVVAVWQRYDRQVTLPVRGLQAVAGSLRNLHQWQPSLAVWQRALAREPGNDDLHSGYLMTLADAGSRAQALPLAQQRVAQAATARRWLDLSYVQFAAGHKEDALQSASQAESRFAGDRQIEQNYLNALSLNRVSGPALLQAAHANPDAVQLRRLQRDAAAEKVRIAFAPSRSEAERFTVADRALADYQPLLAAWQNDPAAHTDYRQARIDRLGALVARSRMQEAVDEYQRLTAEGAVIPTYARRWVAAAFLWLRQPDRAVAIYRSLSPETTAAPLSRTEQSDLFYALAEDEQPDAARRQSDRFVASSPYLLNIFGSPERVPNDDWLDARQLQVQSALLHDDLPAAQQQAEHLARTAPGNQGLQIDVASLWLTRGWPRRAEAELKRVESMEPRSLGLETQQGLTALELQEWRQADLLADDVIKRQPESRSTQRLDRLRDVHRYAELRVQGEHGINSDSPVSGANDVSLDALLYSPPVDENWRIFTGLSFADSEFSEGRGINRSVRGGVEYRTRDNWAEAELNGQRYGSGQKIGARLSGWHDFNDDWRIGGSAERLMREAPLQALRNGITVNGGNLWARWRQSERREWQVSVAPSWFSDGNNRVEWSLDGSERLTSGARYTLDFTPNISGSHNSKTDTPYYSPSRDLAVVPALSLDHLMYRHYQTEWSQQVELGAGAYWQQGQGSGAVTTVSYGQRVRWNDVLDTGVKLTWDKRPYDGVREKNLSVSFDMNYRF